LWSIAGRYKTSVRLIERENGLSSRRLKPGERLRIARRGHRIAHLHRHRITRLHRHRTAELRRRKALINGRGASRTADAPEASPAKTSLDKTDKLKDVINDAPEASLAKTSPDKTSLDTVARISDVPGLKAVASRNGVVNSGLSSAIRAAIVNSMVRESERGEGFARPSVRDRKDVCHRVKRGETLYCIAGHYGTTVSRLRKLNHFRSKKTLLRPGEMLIVRVESARREISGIYTVRPGDTFWTIAEKFQLKTSRLEDINEMDPSDLRPGTKIRLTETAPDIPQTSVIRIKKNIKELRDSEAVAALSVRDRLLLFAKAMLNVPYRFGGTSFYGIDCSAFVQKVYNLLGIHLPRTARQQYREGVPVSMADLTVGDLLFFRTYASFPSHVGIYIGKHLFIYASSGCGVRVGRLETPYFMKRLIGAKRILFDQELPSAGN
ncbi:MAG: LysM peptidoglycan-binding domain-containing protein, partial [Nitrospiraceae bacterium]|nr:LysM peptidoglycan-binding domain-containing protein [Nitrospiraceae bacterium]